MMCHLARGWKALATVTEAPGSNPLPTSNTRRRTSPDRTGLPLVEEVQVRMARHRRRRRLPRPVRGAYRRTPPVPGLRAHPRRRLRLRNRRQPGRTLHQLPLQRMNCQDENSADVDTPGSRTVAGFPLDARTCRSRSTAEALRNEAAGCRGHPGQPWRKNSEHGTRTSARLPFTRQRSRRTQSWHTWNAVTKAGQS
jgi:hypothetical protein